MTLFTNVMSGSGDGQGASAIQYVGMEAVMRKGGAGQSPPCSPLTKSATIRTLQDGFGISHVSNVDLILRKKAMPNAEVLRLSSAGALPSERRLPDFPASIRQSSIEHTVQRRHSAPPTRQPRESENMIIRLASVAESANSIGRNVKGRSRSPDRSLEPGSPKSPRRSLRARSRSPSKCMKVSSVLPPRCGKTATSASSCSWGETHVFDFMNASNSSESLNNSPVEALVTSQATEVLAATYQLKMKAPSSCGSDISTTIGSGGNLSTRGSLPSLTRDCSAPSFFTETIRSNSTSATSIEFKNVCKSYDSRDAAIYEQRIQALVKAAQKASIKKAGK